eukprot:3541790-Rhodomonas_salina.1
MQPSGTVHQNQAVRRQVVPRAGCQYWATPRSKYWAVRSKRVGRQYHALEGRCLLELELERPELPLRPWYRMHFVSTGHCIARA